MLTFSLHILKRTLSIIVTIVAVVLSAHANVDESFVLVTNVSQLHDGDEVVIGNRESSVALSRTTKNAYILQCAMRLSADGQEAYVDDDEIAVFTLEKTSTKWRFHNKTKGWLWASQKGSYELSYNTGSPSNKSNMAKLSIAENGDATIEFDVKNYKFLKYNGSTHFACYMYDTSQPAVQIYRRQRHASDFVISEDADNVSSISQALGGRVDVVTMERSFTADGGYYTICLPFALSKDDIANFMPGAVFIEYTSVAEVGSDKVVFSFRSVETVKAGVPYLLYVGEDIANPIFYDRSIDVDKPSSVTYTLQGKSYTFCGSFAPTKMQANGKVRFVSSDGKRLVTPNSVGELKALRCYFSMPSVDIGANFDADKAKNYVIAIDGEGENFSGTTPIDVVYDENSQAETHYDKSCFDISGCRNSSISRGINIIGGRKVIVK